MLNEEWAELQEVFLSVLNLGQQERERLYCSRRLEASMIFRIEKMLEVSARKDSFLDLGIERVSEVLLKGGTHELSLEDFYIGKVLGGYKVTAAIGEGGMGSVYRAEVEGDGESEGCAVALKVMRRGAYSYSDRVLFAREMVTLKRLKHPNIAALLDSGVTESGVPYFTMELVAGHCIDRFVAENKLPVAEVVRLVGIVAGAVSYAHSLLIVHRDLKPRNILVSTDGVVKVVDFGIAKTIGLEWLEDASVTATSVLSPNYAAPEQLEGLPATTAVDVFALGAVFAELLAISIGNLEGKDHRETAACPSGVRAFLWLQEHAKRRIPDDILYVVGKAINVDPLLRYSTALEFQEDLSALGSGRPIKARRVSVWYRLKKFERRNRVSFWIVFSLTISLGFSTGLALISAQQAFKQEARTSAVRDFVGQVFAVNDLSAGSSPASSMLEKVRSATNAAISGTLSDPLDRSLMVRALARMSISIGVTSDADRLTALLLDEMADHGDLDTEAIELRALMLESAARSAETVSLVEPHFATLLNKLDSHSVKALLAFASARQGVDGSHINAIEVVEAVEKNIPPLDFKGNELDLLLSIHLAKAAIFAKAHFFDDARAALDIPLAAWTKAGKPSTPVVVELLLVTANVRSSLGDVEGGEEAYIAALTQARGIFGEKSLAAADVAGVLGSFYVSLRELEKAEGLLLEAREIRRVLGNDRDPMVHFGLIALARLFATQDRHSEAIKMLDESIDACDRLDLAHEACATSLRTRARVNYLSGDPSTFEEARTDLNKALDISVALRGERSPEVAEIFAFFSELHEKEGDPLEASAAANRALEIWTEVGGGHWQMVSVARRQLAWSQIKLGEPLKAIAILEGVLALELEKAPKAVRTISKIRGLLLDAYLAVGNTAAACDQIIKLEGLAEGNAGIVLAPRQTIDCQLGENNAVR